LAEWLYEAGIGEARAALVEDDRIVEARIERPGGLKLGAVLEGQLIERVAAGLSRIETPHGAAVIERVPPGITQGARLTVEVVREAIPEPGRPKLAKVAASEAEPRDADDLLARCRASSFPVRLLRAHEPDVFTAQAATFRNRQAADALVAELSGQGFRARWAEVQVDDTAAQQQIFVDGYGTLEDALTLVRRLRARATTAGTVLFRQPGAVRRQDFSAR